MDPSPLDKVWNERLSRFSMQLGEEHCKIVLAASLFLALLLLWRLYQFTIYPALRPDEPNELPYWTPLIGTLMSLCRINGGLDKLFTYDQIGHLIEFFGNSDSLLTRARNHFGNAREPFSLTILGMKTYVLTEAQDAADVYRNTQTLSYEIFVQTMMRILGISEQGVQKMFKQLPKDKQGYPNPNGKSLGILFREMHIHQLFPGENLTFLEDRFHKFFDEQLCLERLREMTYSNQAGPDAVTVPLVQWCSDFFTKAGQDAYFGPKLAELDPSLTDHFIVFDELSYQVIYQYPHFLAKEMINSRDRLISAFEQYLELPYDQRTGDAWFVKASEEEMRQIGLRAPDIAKAIMTIYWAINTNSRKASYWLLAFIVQTPSLINVVRDETAGAFRPDGSIDHDFLHTSVPKLDAMWSEMLRVASFAASVRYITADTVIGGKVLRSGNRLIIPYRQLHLNGDIFGDNVESFCPERFLKKPRLSQGINFRPFGGGQTACPGRHIAKRSVLLFVAMVLRRFDIELVPGQTMIEADLTKPVPGLMSPKVGQDMLVRLVPREFK